MKKKISKKMTFGEVMQKDPKIAKKLAEMDLFCGGCPMAMMETIEQGCCMHGMDVNKVLKQLNNATK